MFIGGNLSQDRLCVHCCVWKKSVK